MINRNLAPILHSIKTLPDMLKESLHILVHVRQQNADWRRLCSIFPELGDYDTHSKSLQTTLRPAYEDYISHYSSSLISISLNRAACLYIFAAIIHAERILDLGSGFSSYVFRKYNAYIGHGIVCSIDTSEHWLHQTRSFLQRYGLDTHGLISLSEYSRTDRYDLCFLDIGDLGLRCSLLPGLLHKVKEEGMYLLLDDFHVPQYRRQVLLSVEDKGLQLYSLRKVTRRRLSHMALIMTARQSLRSLP